jgi:hypothetical protein
MITKIEEREESAGCMFAGSGFGYRRARIAHKI